MSDFTAIKKELARVREQKRNAHAALIKIAHENGFFNAEWRQKPVEEVNNTSWMSADPGLDKESVRTIEEDELDSAIQRQNALAWAQWWVKFKEWDLLGQPGTPYPNQVQSLYDKFVALEPEVKELAKEIGDCQFRKKHPGFALEDLLTQFPDELILACWADED